MPDACDVCAARHFQIQLKLIFHGVNNSSKWVNAELFMIKSNDFNVWKLPFSEFQAEKVVVNAIGKTSRSIWVPSPTLRMENESGSVAVWPNRKLLKPFQLTSRCLGQHWDTISHIHSTHFTVCRDTKISSIVCVCRWIVRFCHRRE